VAEERKLVMTISTKSDLIKYPIVIKNLNKAYKDKVAVVDLCLALQNRECFGLLGPNGAGKTTTISILTGLYMPTKGSARVGGYDISTSMDKIHQIMGVCPQFDTLWETLTANETLLFYARLKGANRNSEKDEVMQYLKQVGLEQAADLQVHELSGGMKRRLSVAVALVGNPRVIFLDEPTTGLDPDSRRSLWDVLLEVKKDKCIILTTHSMEEADVLCTRIGIMSHGILKCIGSNVRLKNKFGEGYTLKLNFDQENEEGITSYVKQILPTSHLAETFPGNFTFSVPTADLKMSYIISTLLAEREKRGIKDWGLSQTTLEDVFLNIVKHDEGANNGPK